MIKISILHIVIYNRTSLMDWIKRTNKWFIIQRWCLLTFASRTKEIIYPVKHTGVVAYIVRNTQERHWHYWCVRACVVRLILVIYKAKIPFVGISDAPLKYLWWSSWNFGLLVHIHTCYLYSMPMRAHTPSSKDSVWSFKRKWLRGMHRDLSTFSFIQHVFICHKLPNKKA